MATIKQAKNIIKASIKSKVPVALWAAAGTSKSSIVYQVTQELGIGFIDVRAALTDVGDWNGLPIVKKENDEEIVKFLTSSFLPQDPDWEGVLFMDEISAVTKEVMNCLLQIVLDRKIQNHYVLPEKCYIIAAANPFGYDNPVSELGAALRSRFCHINLSPTMDEWLEYAEEKNIRKDIVGFVKEFPNFLFPKTENFDLKSLQPCPRSLEMLSRIINSIDENHLQECRLEIATGLLGIEAGVQYDQRCKKGYNKINIGKIIKNYKEEKQNVLKFVENGSISEQKQAIEQIFEYKNIDNINSDEFGNIIEFFCDLSSDISYLALKQLENKTPNLFISFVEFKTDEKSKYHKICNQFFNIFKKITKENEQ